MNFVAAILAFTVIIAIFTFAFATIVVAIVPWLPPVTCVIPLSCVLLP